jgi:hypothetical protein
LAAGILWEATLRRSLWRSCPRRSDPNPFMRSHTGWGVSVEKVRLLRRALGVPAINKCSLWLLNRYAQTPAFRRKARKAWANAGSPEMPGKGRGVSTRQEASGHQLSSKNRSGQSRPFLVPGNPAEANAICNICRIAALRWGEGSISPHFRPTSHEHISSLSDNSGIRPTHSCRGKQPFCRHR